MQVKVVKLILIAGLFFCVLGGNSYCYSVEKINLENSNNNLELEAESFYKNQQYSQAIDRLKAAIKEFQQTKDIIGEINARRNLALVYQETGNWQGGKKAIETNLKEINLLQDRTIKQEVIAESLEVFGKINLAIGESEQALKAWERSTNIYRRLGYKNKENNSKIN